MKIFMDTADVDEIVGMAELVSFMVLLLIPA